MRESPHEVTRINHCLDEMTWAGFDEEEIQKQISEMDKSLEEFENMSEVEKKAHTRSIEDFWKELDED